MSEEQFRSAGIHDLFAEQIARKIDEKIIKIENLESSFFTPGGDVIVDHIKAFIYAKFDDLSEALSQVTTVTDKIQQDIDNKKNFSEIVMDISKEPSLSEILIERAYNENENLLQSIVILGEKGVKEVLEIYKLLEAFPDRNYFDFDGGEFLNLSQASAKLSIDVASMVFDVEGRKYLEEVEEQSESGKEQYSVFSDIYFLVLLRYISVGLVDRVIRNNILKVFERGFHDARVFVEKASERNVKHARGAAILQKQGEVFAKIIRAAQALDFVQISNDFLKHHVGDMIYKAYRLDANLFQPGIGEDRYPAIFNDILNYFLWKFYPDKGALIKLNIPRNEVLRRMELLKRDALTEVAYREINDFRPKLM